MTAPHPRTETERARFRAAVDAFDRPGEPDVLDSARISEAYRRFDAQVREAVYRGESTVRIDTAEAIAACLAVTLLARDRAVGAVILHVGGSLADAVSFRPPPPTPPPGPEGSGR